MLYLKGCLCRRDHQLHFELNLEEEMRDFYLARSLTPDQPLVTPKAFLKRAGEPPTETELKMKAHLRKLTTQVLACTKMVKSVAFLPPTAGKFYLQQ